MKGLTKEHGMNVEAEKIRGYRLHAHHLDGKIPIDGLVHAAGACGLQNTPPGAWETALWNRLEGCTLPILHEALYEQKGLLQAWSYRGVPVVFPAEQSDIFLTALISQDGEWPWIYTRGITGALDYLQMPFDDLLLRTKEAAKYLDSHTIKSKETLDSTLAKIIENDLPQDEQALWRGPSMYGNPEKQTVGEAAVSFLLRPCSFSSLVVFGERQGMSPTFTSFKNWTGRMPGGLPGADKELVRKFLHCYGPATLDSFMRWLGCSKKQAHRLWNAISDEMEPVQVEGKNCYMLSEDVNNLFCAESSGEKLILLGAHDPYLDMKDRAVILENKSFHKTVWKFVANPGVVLRGGRIIGIWKTKTTKDHLNISMTLWESAQPSEQRALKSLAEEYATFHQLRLKKYTVENA